MKDDGFAAWVERRAELKALMWTEYVEGLEDHINSTVAPALREKEDEFLLREVAMQWENYSRTFRQKLYSDFTILISPNGLYATETLKRFFCDEVSANNVVAALMRQINRSRQDESSPDDGGTVLKNVVCMLQDFWGSFYVDFQSAILKNAAAHYSRKRDSRMPDCSCLDYLFNVAKYLGAERETIAVNCVRQSRQREYVETVEKELLDCHPLLRNEKIDDKLYSGIERCIRLMAMIFRKHVTEHCKSLVEHGAQMVTGAITENNQIIATARENYEFVKSVFLLHEKYSQFVEEKFMITASFARMHSREPFRVLAMNELQGTAFGNCL